MPENPGAKVVMCAPSQSWAPFQENEITLALSAVSALIGPTPVPDGFVRIPVDCNSGAGRDTGDVFVCYRRDRPGNVPPVTSLAVISGMEAVPNGYTKINVNLNYRAGPMGTNVPRKKEVYICYKTGGRGLPIIDLLVRAYETGLAPNKIPPGYEAVSYDLNRGVGGDYVYLFFRCAKVVESPFVPYGIQADALENPNLEYELDSVQIDNKRRLVRLQRLYTIHEETIEADLPFAREITIERG